VEIRDPQERLRTALSELYDFYARTEPMRANVLRDAESMPELATLLEASVMAGGRACSPRSSLP
jgi:hypothetical protein